MARSNISLKSSFGPRLPPPLGALACIRHK